MKAATTQTFERSQLQFINIDEEVAS
jgi:hypothetical protein